MIDTLANTLADIEIRDYDESKMSKEDIEKVRAFVPPIVFRWMQYPDSDDFELEVKYLIDVNKDGALFTPWTEVPAFMMQLIDEHLTDEETPDGTMH